MSAKLSATEQQRITAPPISLESDRVFIRTNAGLAVSSASLGFNLSVDGHRIIGGIADSKGTSPPHSEFYAPRQEIIGQGAPQGMQQKTSIAARKGGIKGAGPFSQYPSTEHAVSKDCPDSIHSFSNGSGNENESDRGQPESGCCSDVVRGIVYRNRSRSNSGRQNCTEVPRQNCAVNVPRRNCTEVRGQKCTDVRRDSYCTEVRSGSSTNDQPYSRGGKKLLGEQLSGSFPSGSWSQQAKFKKRKPGGALSERESQARQDVVGGETPSWMKVVRPYRDLRISEENWPALSKEGSIVGGKGSVDERGTELVSTTNAAAAAAATTTTTTTKRDDDGKGGLEYRQQWPSLMESLVNNIDVGSNVVDDGLVYGDEEEENCKVAGIGERKIWQPVRSILQKEYGWGREEEAAAGSGKGIDEQKGKEKAFHGVFGVEQQQQTRKTNRREADFGIPPVLLMLNEDFIVTSPLKQNLLLTLALTERKWPVVEVSEDGPEEMVRSRERERRQILVGQFTAFSSFLHFGLGRDATRVRTESNAGGTSTISESLSVEYFVRRFQAKDIVTEMEVEYCALNWKKVDYICTLYGQRVGVSVTRAMSFPDPKDFSAQMAYRLLYKKLFGLVVARHGVSKRHSFSQCILHVWCETQDTAKILEQEYEGVSEELDITDDVIMVLTVAEGWHARPIFYESILKRVAA